MHQSIDEAMENELYEEFEQNLADQVGTHAEIAEMPEHENLLDAEQTPDEAVDNLGNSNLAIVRIISVIYFLKIFIRILSTRTTLLFKETTSMILLRIIFKSGLIFRKGSSIAIGQQCVGTNLKQVFIGYGSPENLPSIS